MNMLSIGGSDPSSGAGIQNDIKTATSLGAYCFAVVTAITSQNTKKFSNIKALSSKTVKEQIESVLSDFSIDAIKIGMVYNSSVVKAIFSKLQKLKIPIILDPVIKSTTGGTLMRSNTLADYKKFLLPLAFFITPNKSEAELLTGLKLKTKKDLFSCANKIRKMGAQNIVITGIKTEKNKISDFVATGKKYYFLSSKKILKENHGSGCTFSSALAASLANKKTIDESIQLAKKITYESISNATKIGKGVPITQIKPEPLRNELSKSISNFVKIKNIHLLIPEVQTNFVFSKQNPSTVKDVMGVSGRIVKSGKSVFMAGNLNFGGSKHVASAIVSMSKKFPEIRSALNIKYEPKLIKKFQKQGLKMASYDRSKEPLSRKTTHSSISWGINESIKKLKTPPDVIYHKGDFGKEAMVMIFGKKPQDVIKKISRLN